MDMSAHTKSDAEDSGQGATIATLAVPALVAVLAMAMAMMNGGAAPASAGDSADQAAPTPYSADHARVQNGPGAAEEPAPTF
jgi:hypothetical protein